MTSRSPQKLNDIDLELVELPRSKAETEAEAFALVSDGLARPSVIDFSELLRVHFHQQHRHF